jgi:cytochrome c
MTMMTRKNLLTALVAVVTLVAMNSAMAQDDGAAMALASETYCNSTATDQPTDPKHVMAKVDEAIALLEKEGTAAFPKFQGDGSPFIFEGTYIWIHSLTDGTMLMHPIKYKLNGQNIIGMKDTDGKRFFATMNKVVRENGSGWVEYQWPKPGTTESIHKVSYVKGCKTADGVEVVVGCGLYKVDQVATAGLSIN